MTPNKDLEDATIDDVFDDEFYDTNFWIYWQTMFAFEKWHSALEMKLYLQRYIHHIDGLPDLSALRFTRYNQYESMVPMGGNLNVPNVELGCNVNQRAMTAMLTALSGRTHNVFTGVTVIKGTTIITEYERTLVRFRELSEREIRAYIATGEPLDKAGSYGAQGVGALFTESIEGDFFAVMQDEMILPEC